MKKTHFPFVLALLFAVSLFAQQSTDQICVPISFDKHNFTLTKRIDKKLQTAYFIEEAIPLKFHIVRNGTAVFDDTTHVADLLTLMNNTFIDANIQFEKCEGINFIENSVIADGYDPTTVKNQLHDIHGKPNVINIYVANSTVSFGGFSYAGPSGDTGHFIQDNAIVMSGSQYVDYDTFLLAHELGHYFGLYHPSETTNGLELVDGSNCEVSGDFCCDTPAARPGMCCRFNCDFVASPEVTYDSQGDSINPDIKNIMSTMAFTLDCREYFTPDQYDRMAYYHENYLLNMSCSANVSVDELSVSNVQFELVLDKTSRQVQLILNQPKSNWSLQMYDITGALVYEQSKINNQQHTIDINRIKAGVYVFVFEYDDEYQQIKLLIEGV